MNNEKIWIINDSSENCNDEHILQLVSKASWLGQKKKEDVVVVCIGEFDKIEATELFRHGADKVLVCCQEKRLGIREFSDVLERMINEFSPEIILFQGSEFGRTIACFLSTRFEAGLTADCIDIDVSADGNYIFSRAAINSSVIANIVCINSRFAMCTVKPNVFVKQETLNQNSCKIEYYKEKNIVKNSSVANLNVISRIRVDNDETIDFNSAKLVFGIGRGIKGETLVMLKKVANKYRATIVGTRAAVEENLIEKSRQVGQSGISICPNIYIGFGISGASQHMVGIKNADIIIAVNNNPEAQIFKYADYAIVDDAYNILNEMYKLSD